MAIKPDGQITLGLAIKETTQLIKSQLKSISDKLHITVTGKLDKAKTKSQIKKDLATINEKVNLTGKLDKAATRKKLKEDINSLDGKTTVNIKANVDTKDLNNKLKNIKPIASKINIDADINDSETLNNVSDGMDSINKKSASTVANVTLMNQAINGLENAGRKMVETAADLDEKLTDLRMVTGENYEEASKLVDEYNKLAKELGSTTVEVLDASSEWLRQGKTEAETAELIQQSMILSKVGAMDSATATERLTSTMNGYKLAVEDVAGVVDKFTAVDMAAAVSADELAESLSHTASSAYLARIDINKIIAYLTVVEETTRKSASVVGESFKSIFARIGKVTNGDAIDDMGEDISKVETTLRSLGIELRKSENEFRNYDEILDEVGAKWSSYSTVVQRQIATAFGGVYQSENFLALMNNYDKVSKYVKIAEDSAGTATQKFTAYQESVEAHANELIATAESLAKNTVSADFMNGLMSAGTNLLEFVDNAELLQLALNNIVAGGAVKGVTLLVTKMKDASKNIAQLSTAFNILKNSANTNLSFEQFNELLTVTKGLTTSQLRLVVSNKVLTTQQRIAILTSNGLTAEEAKQTLATMGLATAEGAATTATFSLSGAMDALKTAFLSNPIGILVMTLSTAISLISTATDKTKQLREESIQAAQESAQAYQESADSVDEYKDKITELRKEIDSGNLSEEEAYNKRQELISIQETLIEMFGDEAEAINLVTGEINTQIAAIDELNKKEWKNWRQENYNASEKAIDSITNPSSDYGTVISMNLKDEEYIKAIEEALGTQRYFQEGSGVLIEIPDKYTEDLFALREAYGLVFDAADKYVSQLDESDPSYKEHQIQLERLSKTIQDIDDELESHEDIFNTYAEGQLLYGEAYNKTWSKVLAAQKEYDEAVLSGDSQAIQDAVKKMNDAEAEFGKLKVDDEAVALYAEDYFEKFNAETKKHKATIELSTDDSEIKNLAQNAVKTFEDESGKVDLHSVLNVGTEYENLSDGAKRNKILTEEEQAYVELKYAANEYGVTVEDLLNILDDLGYIELDVAGATDDLVNSINGLSDAISTLDSMSDLGETMNSIIGSLKDGDGLQFGDLKSLSEQMTELGLSTDEYLEKLLDAGNSADEVQNVFAELTNELISQKVASGDLTEADEQMLAIWLESIGVANAASIAHNALAIDKDMVAEAETLLANATEGTISSVYEEIAAMMSEQGVTQATKQKLFELALQKLRVNENEIVTSSDIEQLIALADAAGATAASLENLAQAKAYYAEAERLDKLAESTSTERGKSEAKSQANSYRQLAEQWANKPIEYEKINPDDFIITPTGNGSGGSSGSGKDANLDVWEKLVKQKKHLVETDQMTQEQYYDWLRSEYKSHLSDTEKYADELMSIEKELYDWEKQRIQASIDDELAVLDNQKAKGLISEEEYFKKLDELYSDGYSDLQQAVEEHNLYGVDNTERLQAETEFLEKVKDAHNSAYDAERQALDHKLAMNLISEEQYLIELQRLYDQYYKGQDMYSEEAMEIEEELYDKRVELVEKWAQAAVDAINEITEATEGMVDAIAQLIEDSIDTNEENFNLEKQFLDHALAMNYISEKDYYNSLEKLYKKYFKDKNLYMEQYWENQEAVYQYEQEALEDSASAIEDIHAKVVEMIKAEHEEAIEGIEETKNEYLDLIEIRRKALEEFKSDEDYEKERSDKLASIAELRRQLNALSYDTSAAGVAKYKEVYAQLKEAEEELADFERERSYDVMNKQLDNEESAIETKYDDEIAKHEDFLDNNEALVEEAWARLNDKNNDLYNQLIDYNKKYSTSIADDVTGSWEKATEALQRYSDAKAGYKDIVGNIGKSGMTDEEYSQFQKTTEGKQIYGWIKTALTFAGSMISVGAGLLSGFMGIAGSLMGGTGGSFLSMGSGVVGSVAGFASSVLGVLGGFATGTDYVSKTGWYRTDELGNEFKFVKDNQGNQYRFLTEGSKVVDAKTTDIFMKLVRSPDLFANTIKNQILSEIDATRSISNVIDSSSNEVNINNEFIIQSTDPKGVAAEVEKLMPKITKNTISTILSGTNKLGVKQKVQHLY